MMTGISGSKDARTMSPGRSIIPALLALTLAAGSGTAAAQEIQRHQLAADQIMIDSFTGILTVATAEVEAVDLGFVAHADALTIGIAESGTGMAEISFERPDQSGFVQDDTFQRRLGLAADGKSVAFTDTTPPRPDDPPELLLVVPPRTSLFIDALIGEARIGALESEIALRLLSGEAAIERAGGALLFVDGAGSIEVGEIVGDAALTVVGSGDIEVAQGRIRLLTVLLDGSGEIRFGGSSERADIMATGAGMIALGPVAELGATEIDPGVVLEVEGR